MALIFFKAFSFPRPFRWMVLFVGIYVFIINVSSWNRPFLFSDETIKLESALLTDRSKPTKDLPLVFIGGCPRSGTTLMRVLLDSHPQVACGPETHVLPKLVIMYNTLLSPFEQTRLQLAGINKALLNMAMRDFFLDIILGRIKKGNTLTAPNSSNLLCNKDPFLMNNGIFLKRLFPKAKFIFMIRDGRAVAHSIIARKISITKFNLSSYEHVLKKWNTITESMLMQCEKLGSSCLKVHYEKLVLNPKPLLQVICRFLDIPWNDTVLKHDQLIADGTIKLNTLERSSDQVIKPINPEPLTSWMGNIPSSILADLNTIAPMLKILGYDPAVYPPEYGKVDQFVRANMRSIAARRREWNHRSAEIVGKREALRKKLQRLGREYSIKRGGVEAEADEFLLEHRREEEKKGHM